MNDELETDVKEVRQMCRPKRLFEWGTHNFVTTHYKCYIRLKPSSLQWTGHIPVCIQKLPNRVDNEMYAYNNKHSLRSNIKDYGGTTH
jgi:hypothetical protein